MTINVTQFDQGIVEIAICLVKHLLLANSKTIYKWGTENWKRLVIHTVQRVSSRSLDELLYNEKMDGVKNGIASFRDDPRIGREIWNPGTHCLHRNR